MVKEEHFLCYGKISSDSLKLLTFVKFKIMPITFLSKIHLSKKRDDCFNFRQKEAK